MDVSRKRGKAMDAKRKADEKDESQKQQKKARTGDKPMHESAGRREVKQELETQSVEDVGEVVIKKEVVDEEVAVRKDNLPLPSGQAAPAARQDRSSNLDCGNGNLSAKEMQYLQSVLLVKIMRMSAEELLELNMSVGVIIGRRSVAKEPVQIQQNADSQVNQKVQKIQEAVQRPLGNKSPGDETFPPNQYCILNAHVTNPKRQTIEDVCFNLSILGISSTASDVQLVTSARECMYTAIPQSRLMFRASANLTATIDRLLNHEDVYEYFEELTARASGMEIKRGIMLSKDLTKEQVVISSLFSAAADELISRGLDARNRVRHLCVKHPDGVVERLTFQGLFNAYNDCLLKSVQTLTIAGRRSIKKSGRMFGAGIRI